MYDSHVHVGAFKEGIYFDPVNVVQDMQKLGVKKWIFSSTSVNSHSFNFIRKEIETTCALSGGNAYPFLRVTPSMMQKSRNLSKYFFCRFYGLKIHGHDGWNSRGKAFNRIFEIARDMSLPIMLHTGGLPECEAGMYLDICSRFRDVTVVLAHGRPIEEAILVMNNCPNVYVDTAFMPLNKLKKLVECNLTPRVLIGTDYPITSYYYQTPRRTYYRRRIKKIRNVIGESIFNIISVVNFMRLIHNSHNKID